MPISRKLFYNKLIGRGTTIVINVFIWFVLFVSICDVITGLLYLSGGITQVTVTGKREIKRGNGLELPCKVTVKVRFLYVQKQNRLFVICVQDNRTKIMYYFNNFAISYIHTGNWQISKTGPYIGAMVPLSG